ncbi:MAG: hypothetical protein WCJ19_02995 [bacterium]
MFINIKCLAQACDELEIPYKFIDDNKNFLSLNIKGQSKYFINTITPFNSEIDSKICTDKDFTYQLLHKEINMPESIGYIDPFINKKNLQYVKFQSFDDIKNDILSKFSLPLIVKKNNGSFSTNVFLCRNEHEILTAIETIFNQKSKDYDYLLLAQDFVNIVMEYRVITFEKKVLLVYEKSTFKMRNVRSNDTSYENMHAHRVNNDEFTLKLESFLSPLFDKFDLKFCGFDIAVDRDGNLSMIEMNSKPWFDKFVLYNGERPLIDMYKYILQNA